MNHFKLFLYLTLAFFIPTNDAARILCLFPFNGRSHHIMFDALCKGLAKKGYRVDMISHFPTRKAIPNYTDIVDLNGTIPAVANSFTIEFGKKLHKSLTYYIAKEYGYNYCELMGHEKMQKFIKSASNKQPYDLILTEYFGMPCNLGFGELLQAPVGIVLSTIQMPHVDQFMGNPHSYAFFPHFFTYKPVIENFFDRLWNFVTNYKEELLFHYYSSDQTEITRKYLHMPHLPDIRELEKKVSLALTNTHHSLFGIRPLTPAIVEISGLHIESEQPELNPELSNWLESANHGLVLFTLGSFISIDTLPIDTLLSLYASFDKIAPVKVLMKYPNTTKLPSGLPSNVMTLPWIPQISVLRHRNTRVFITHGGLLGTEEALYYAIPMLGMPLFSDQIKNINNLVRKNVARLLPLDDISEHSMDVALNALLHDPKYRESAKRLSAIFKDRPLSPMDTAAFWIEYVIKHGADSLKSPAVHLPWWKLNLLDVYAFLIVCFIVTISGLIVLLRILLKTFWKSSAVQMEKKVKWN